MVEKTLSVGIIAHPKRLKDVMVLKRQFQDEAPHVPVQASIDLAGEGCGPNSVKTWALWQIWETDYHLVLSDDIILCRDFLPTLLKVINMVPEGVAVLPYVGGKINPKTLERGHHWTKKRPGAYGQARAFPADMVQMYLRWVEKYRIFDIPNPRATTWDDYWEDLFALSVDRADMWVMVPNLVQHKAGESLLGHNSTATRSQCFIGADRSGLEVDWTQGLDQPLSSGGLYSLKELPALGIHLEDPVL